MAMRHRPDDPEVLLEAATGAYRERDSYGRLKPSPAWADLAPAQRPTRHRLELDLGLRLAGAHGNALRDAKFFV